MIREDEFVFNIVLTGNTFRYLHFFVNSLIHESEARYRLLLNAVSDESQPLIQEFSAAHPKQVIEVFEVTRDDMVGHGKALDAVYGARDDGDYFCFVDPDIKANGPFIPEFGDLLIDHVAVSSGKEVWTDDNVVPSDHPGLGGRHFYDSSGFVYGCPHLAMYHREPLEETRSRWDVGFGSGGPEVAGPTRDRLAEMGHLYAVYDTAKIVNILLQGDGHTLCHHENPRLVHIGGLTHYLSPPTGPRGEDGDVPGWARFEGTQQRLEVTRFTASLLRSLIEEQPAPSVPSGLDPDMEHRLEVVEAEVVDLVARYSSW